MTEAEPAARMGQDAFVHLHTHSEYSLLDGAARISELVGRAASMGQPAVAVTDHGVLYGAVDLYTEATAAGVKPILGCEVYMAPRSHRDKEGRADRDPHHLVLLARNATGYANLVALSTRSHLDGYYYKPRIDKQLLAQHSEGLICLSGCIGGELPQAILGGDLDVAERVARQHQEIFDADGYFLELQDHGMAEETAVREGLIEIARRTGLPLICTNDSHYIDPADAEAHDILLCLQTGARRDDERRFRFHGPDFYLASGEEMRRRFEAYGEAAANTLAVAERCDWRLELGQHHLPAYSPIPEGMDADSYLAELCAQGLRERYGDDPSREARERLAMELDVIRQTGFAAYFLIVWDLVRAARCDGVVVGPGRGSAAGSLVAYVLRITNVDPLRYGLIFERFLNLERVEMPDIDIDFDDRRDRVLQYVTGKYGQDRVAQIITFGTMAARAAIRDVGRVLDVPLPDVDRLAKLVPATIGITLDRAVAEARELRDLYESEPWARSVIDIARRLEGISRNASTHAAGVVIGAEPLASIVPLARATSGNEGAVTQFDMKGVSKIGLLKMDFLGLTNLTVIQGAVENIERTRGMRLDIDAIPLDDPATYELLGKADTHGIFQFEATFAKRILIDMQPRSLEDLAAANALNRPGPIEGKVVDLYIRRRRGEEPVSYLLPEMEPILAETFGTMIYQDQVMKIASAVAGFTLGEADLLRSAMGKKDKLKMAQQREKFLRGATSRGVDEATAAELFDLIAYFAGYGFNKAHAVCYALIGYQTAYLKANHPLEYMAALLNSRAGDFDKLKQTILDAHARGLTVLLPDINRSQPGFAVGDPDRGEILYGLAHIKNTGERAMEQIVEERRGAGPYTSLFDLCLRAGGRDLNRRVLEALVRSGACDGLGERAMLLATLDRALDRATQIRRERELGQGSLFGASADASASPLAGAVDEFGVEAEVAPVAADERLRWEREHLGMYLSDHPLRRIADRLGERVDTAIGELGAHLDGVYVQIGGAIRDLRAFIPRRSATGQRMAFMTLEDLSGACEVVVFARIFEEAVELLLPDQVIVVRGRVQAGRNGRAPLATAQGSGATLEEEEHPDAEPVSVIAEAVYGLDDVRLTAWRRNSRVRLRLRPGQEELLPALRAILERHRGEAPALLQAHGPRSVDEVALGESWTVEPGPALERAVDSLLGDGAYRLEVDRQRAAERETTGRRR